MLTEFKTKKTYDNKSSATQVCYGYIEKVEENKNLKINSTPDHYVACSYSTYVRKSELL